MKLHRIRIGTDIHMNVKVTESGIPIDWNNTQAVALVVKNMANSSPYTVSRFDNHTFAKCATTASATDRTVLDVCLPAKEQLVRCLPAECDYRVIVTVKHDGATASYDALAFTLVPTSDLAGPPEESEDPINLNLQLEEITSSEIKRMVEEATWLLNTTVASEAERQENEGVRQENERQRMEEYGGIKDELVRLTETANEAAEAAQTATTEAGQATKAATEAAIIANSAAAEADRSRIAADQATIKANNATQSATVATNRANSSATSADNATANATNAAQIATNTANAAALAAQSANDAADRANAAAGAVEPYETRLEDVEGKVTELEEEIGNIHPYTDEEGYHVVDAEGNIGMQYTEDGFGAAKIQPQFVEVLKEAGVATVSALDAVSAEVEETGFFFVDEQLNVGVKVDGDGIHAKNILEYEIINN